MMRRVGYQRIQKLSPELAEFLTLDPPFASIRFCTIYIGMYRFLSSKLDLDQPTRLLNLFRDHSEMITAFPNIAFGENLARHGFITREILKEKWNNARYEQIETLLGDCRVLARDDGNSRGIPVKRFIDSKENTGADDLQIKQYKESIRIRRNELVQRWNDLGLTPFDV